MGLGKYTVNMLSESREDPAAEVRTECSFTKEHSGDKTRVLGIKNIVADVSVC
jgi:hypothetical protein